jgi:hypothetical protein
MAQQTEKLVELEKVIESSSNVHIIEIEEDTNKNEIEKLPSFSQKIIGFLFSSTKKEDTDEDEILKAIVRDDIENPVPVVEEMIRDKVVEPSVVEPPVKVVEPPVVVVVVVESPVLPQVEEQIDLQSVKKPLTTEVHPKLTRHRFFCCTM